MANPDSQESKYWKLMSELKQKIVDDTYQAGNKCRRRMNWLLFIR